MALSMDEQRILDEMERKLAEDDPSLASRLASFTGPALGTMLRSPRARVLAWVAALTTVAVVMLVVYAMMPFRGSAGRGTTTHHPASTPGVTKPVKLPGSAGSTGAKAKASKAPSAGG